MTTTFGRRAFLKGAAAAGALACGPFILRRPALGKNGLRSVDDALSQAVESKAMPGVVVVAATDKAILYEGAFGKRELGKEAPMTADTVVWIASMTKAITATAAMQLIERGKLSLEQPASEVVPDIAAARVLEGFDASGKPRLRAPKRPITLKHLLTHTAGFGYDIWDSAIGEYEKVTGTPGIITCKNAALTTPLMFDPGDRWEYGISIDWAGKMVEAVSGTRLDQCLRENIFEPLGMSDTSFTISPSQRSRLASVHQRDDKGALSPIQFEIPQEPEFFMGGGGLYGTARDYLAFTQMIMHGGTFRGAQVLRPETVALMSQNHIGALEIPVFRTAAPPLSNDIELFPGMSKKWGLSFLINTQQTPSGRSAGSLAWAGLANTYFWIDPTKRVSGVFLSQVLPFYDRTAIELLGKFETEVYGAL
ncbi:MAG: 1,4-butanediol diacrylate esterase [Candidatus Rokuibacteriota bacterium]|nr:MAG: 1,4-butanediol diacrylate esterase [Candidatus Rokubacteria bacterium]